jgi:hypothetical protein
MEVPMDRCQEIFERIKSQQLAAIENFVADRQAEELFLDFKRSSSDGAEKKLSGSDRKNLSKAISGFGNSEGGVIIWGVDCSTDFDGADVAKALVPIENPVRFASLLQGAISGCTIPPHTGVQNEVIEIGDGKGFVVTLIPKSDATPHQSVQNKQYYIRAGSDFVPTPHDVLGGMFGRRPQPHVFHHFLLATPKLKDNELIVSFGFVVHNEGPGIASDVFAICRMESLPGPHCQMLIDTPDRTNWTGGWEFGRQMTLIGVPGYRLPPGSNAQPMVVNLSLSPPFREELRIFGRVGAGESRRYNFYIAASAELIEQHYNLFVDKFRTDPFSFTDNEKREIAEVIFKQREV